MAVTSEELLTILTEASYRFQKELKQDNSENKLYDFLIRLGMEDLLPLEEPEPLYDTFPDGKVLIIGSSEVNENKLLGCLKSLGIDKSRVECYLDYSKTTNIDFTKIQYNPNYRLVLFGPLPHSMKGKGKESSIISRMENEEGYPKAIKLISNQQLKITKSNLKETIKKEINTGYLKAS